MHGDQHSNDIHERLGSLGPPNTYGAEEKLNRYNLTIKEKTKYGKQRMHDKIKSMYSPIGRVLGGYWYIRFPLWLRSTILIFSIGFITLLILLVVSATKVWCYSESLMGERLSNMAGMTALQMERSFSPDAVLSLMFISHPNAISFFKASNSGNITLNDFYTFEDQLGIDTILSRRLWALDFYDLNFKRFYSYRHRGTAVSVVQDQQGGIYPRSMFPLSYDNLRNKIVHDLERHSGAIIANYTISSTDEQGTWNLTYSITRVVSSLPNMLRPFDSMSVENIPPSDVIGYATFVFQVPISFSNPSNSFNIGSGNSFNKFNVDVVREADIFIDGHSYKPHTWIPQSEQQAYDAYFVYLYPQTDGVPFPIDDFPVLTRAVDLANNNTVSYLGNASNKDIFYKRSAMSSPRLHQRGLQVHIPTKQNTHLVWDANGKARVIPLNHKVSRSKMGNHTGTNVSLPGTNSTPGSGFGGSGNSNSSPIDQRDENGKPIAANMDTTSPFINKATVGYSFSMVYNEIWLVFVELSRDEAFCEIRYIRNVLIAVGCAIMGAVLIIVVPLSRWQTRSLYVIYRNMQLRPLFIMDTSRRNSSSQKSTTDGNGTGGGDTENSKESDQISGARDIEDKNENIVMSQVSPQFSVLSSVRSVVSAENSGVYSVGRLNNNNIGDREAYPEAAHVMEIQNTSTSSSSLIHSMTRSVYGGYRFTVPLPLPKLNRWYTDELDELVDGYNAMVEALNRHYHHLEDQVRLRTREAQKAGELREEANAAKSEFIAIISHELRTPLNGIMGLTAVNAEETDITKTRNGLETIIESGRVLMELLNELLELSKSLVGVEPTVSCFTPASLLEMLSTMFVSRTSTLSTNFALGTVPPQLSQVQLQGDMDHIVQICLNFMSNAMKFSADNGNVSVLLHLRPYNDPFVTSKPYHNTLPNPNGILEVLVTDSGTGISQSQLTRIFDLFVQGDNPLQKNHKGAGLGMALSKQLADGIGGYVTVFSAEEVGSTVALRVPVHVIDHNESEVLALNGPMLEFNVRDAYSTMSLRAGDVRMVRQAREARASYDGGNLHRNISHGRKQSGSYGSRHHQHTSLGSKMLLNKSHGVTKLLRAQPFHHQRHHQHHSQSTNKTSKSKSSGSINDTTSTMENNLHRASSSQSTDGREPEMNFASVFGGIEAVSGTHYNASASSLLPNVPQNIFDTEVRQSVSSDNGGGKRTSVVSSTASSGEHKFFGEYVAPIKMRPDRLSLQPSSAVSFTNNSDRVPNLSFPTALNSAASSEPPFMYISSPDDSDQVIDNIKDMRILIAEDNKLNQQIMVKMLQQIGVHIVDTSDDGDTLIQLVEMSIIGGYHYDLIFMDLNMPGKNGIDATQIIRGTLGYPYPIVALTGFSDLETRNACRAVNIEEVLTKPIMKNEILRVLHSTQVLFHL